MFLELDAGLRADTMDEPVRILGSWYPGRELKMEIPVREYAADIWKAEPCPVP